MLDFFISLLEFIMLFASTYYLFENRKTNIRTFINLLLSAPALAFVITLFDGYPTYIRIIITILFQVLIYKTVFKTEWYVNTAISVLWLYVFGIVDIVFGNLFSVIFAANFVSLWSGNNAFHILINLIIKSADAIAFYVLCHKLKSTNLNIRPKEWRLLSFIFVVCLVIIIVFVELFPKDIISFQIHLLFLIVSTLFLAMNTAILYFFTENCGYYEKRRRQYAVEHTIKIFSERRALSEQAEKKLRKLRHDQKGHNRMVAELLRENKVDDALSMLDEIGKRVENSVEEHKKLSANNIIDNIVYFNSDYCKSKNIDFQYNIEPLPQIDFDMVDLCSVMDNLLENAVEASEKTDNPFVHIKIHEYRFHLFIEVENSFNGEIIADCGNLITTKGDKSSHGFGTQIISQIADKYFGNFKFSHNNKIFKATAILKIPPEN